MHGGKAWDMKKTKAPNQTVHDTSLVVSSVFPTYLSIALCIALWPAAAYNGLAARARVR